MAPALLGALGACLGATAALAELRGYEGYSFDAYLREFNKSYGPSELASRRAVFEGSLQRVLVHNAQYAAGQHTWYMAMNHLADWTPAELKRLRATKHSPGRHPVATPPYAGRNPDAVDWRSKGAVSAVKDQGMCGSCWAFSATEAVESHYQIASGKLLTLSPQTYVDCVENPHECGGTGGCEGATMELAFNLTVSKGIALESDLPYTQKDGSCPAYKPAVKVDGYVKLPTNDAKSFETAIATIGPVSVTVAADAWMLYGGGIFHACSDKNLNTLDHGVLAVGYTKDAWIVRNSWGPSWGEAGYIRLSRSSDAKVFQDEKPEEGVACKPMPRSQTVGGECGILFDTSYPVGAKSAAVAEAVLV